jgi:16S rRNA processing protein RimM
VSEPLVPLGEIVTTHGIEGWLKLRLYNPQSTLLSSLKEIFLETGGSRSPHSLVAIRPHQGNLLIKLRGIDTINDARKWIPSVLCIPADVLQPLKPGEYYHYQVVGLEVYDTAGSRIGAITRIWHKEGGDLYVVQGNDKEYLIPATKEVIEKVDFSAGKMIIRPPAGLLDL